jgi:hypothetical protein
MSTVLIVDHDPQTLSVLRIADIKELLARNQSPRTPGT